MDVHLIPLIRMSHLAVALVLLGACATSGSAPESGLSAADLRAWNARAVLVNVTGSDRKIEQKWRYYGGADTVMLGNAQSWHRTVNGLALPRGALEKFARRNAEPVLTRPAATSLGGAASTPSRIRVILDTDANNELDDQHAIAYMLFSGDAFDVEGITVNRTRGGGDVEMQAREAERIVKLAGLERRFAVIRGANGTFAEIAPHVQRPDFDGATAVDLIVRRAHVPGAQPLVLLPVGKLTNIALALKKDPSIAPRVRIVWLGSNYPEPGEYNQENDEGALQFILDSDVAFEIALVRWGKPSGTAAVRVSLEEIRAKMPGKGPRVGTAVIGRNGGRFFTFGDYSVNLFEHIDLNGSPPARALFDMAAVSIVKNPGWARAVRIPAPRLVDGKWRERPGNSRTVVLWENFDREAIMRDFYATMDRPVLAR